MSYLSVSTWSLHRLLGPLRWTVWDAEQQLQRTVVEPQPQLLTLLELPAEAAKRGFRAIEICHFHFPSVDRSYLAELAQACDNAGVSFDTLLLDYGDLTSTDDKRVAADLQFMRDWITIASQAGAKQIRIIAGEAHPSDGQAIERAARHLLELAEYGASIGVTVVTENFKPLTSTGESCVALLEQADHWFGMITDFGNFQGERKYAELAMTIPHSVSVHAKADVDENGEPDVPEFQRCLEAVQAASYDGAVVLIYDGPGDMWQGIERMRRLVQPLL